MLSDKTPAWLNSPISISISVIVLLTMVYFPIFGHLDTLSIRLWDESRLSINAYEMHKNGNWLVTHYDGKPDMWNTKPPLMIWLQVAGMKLFGVNELAVRLPSALAGFFTCILLMILAVRLLKNFWFGAIAVLVLATTQGYINEHSTRTGDYDALVTLFISSACLAIFLFTETKKNKYLYLFFGGLTLAVLTKGIAPLLFIPGIIFYVLSAKLFVPILKIKHLYLGFAAFLIVSLGYYLLRESYNPGYIRAVMENELGGRYLKVVEGNTGDFFYYFDNLKNSRLAGWLLFVPCGVLLGFLHKDKKIFRLTLFTVLVMVSYFIIISASKTKLEWYDVPIFPFIAVIITISIYYAFNYLFHQTFFEKSLSVNIVPLLFLFLVFASPYKKILDKTFAPKEPGIDFYRTSYFLRDALHGKRDVDHSYFLYNGYNPHHWFYIRTLQDKGVNIDYKDWTKLEVNDKVIACQDDVKNYINEHYTSEVLGSEYQIFLYKITGLK